MSKINKSLVEWNGKLGLPEWNKIENTDYEDAFEEALQKDRWAIDKIADNEDEPTYKNVIDELDYNSACGDLSKVSALFWNLIHTDSDEVLRMLEQKIAPKLSRHASETAANKKLFGKIDALWENRQSLGLDVERERVLEKYHRGFVHRGAKLNEEGQKRLADINAELAANYSQFSQNILADESEWSMMVEEGDVEGLPDSLKSAMREAANERKQDGYAITLSRSIIEPFLGFSGNRELRKVAFEAWKKRGENEGKRDNRPIAKDTLRLRQEKAKLLGYKNFAEFALEDRMAKKPEDVTKLLGEVWEKAKVKAEEEDNELREVMASEGKNHSLEAFDRRYYAEITKNKKFDFDEAALAPYFPLDAMINAAFDVATRLFGLSFQEIHGEPLYHPDARLFEVFGGDKKHKALFIGDYFARSSKRSGAWMSGFQSQHKLNGGQTPIIVNVMNFAKAPEGEQTLLSPEDARTLFHEFGHALHGMLSDVTYPSVSGTSVARDFVELPSQLYEHWLLTSEVLKKHAKHFETGKTIPSELVDKVLEARKFNSGFDAIEYTASALIDMDLHTADNVEDVTEFENKQLTQLGMPSSMSMRHRIPHFGHTFSGDGYSAGYYSYMWSEVLDADAFQAFEETKDLFDSETAKKLHDNIYSVGGSIDPEDTYCDYRGKMPSIDAMIEKRGLG